MDSKNNDISKKPSRAKAVYVLPDWYKKVMKGLETSLKNKAVREALKDSSMSKIFIPSLSNDANDCDPILGVIGGYFYQSASANKKIKAGHPQPLVQLNLRVLSQATGINYGDTILQVWSDGSDWGVGERVFCDTVAVEKTTINPDKSCVGESHYINLVDDEAELEQEQELELELELDKDFLELNDGSSRINYFNSDYNYQYGLKGPIFLTGLDDAGFNLRTINQYSGGLTKEKYNLVSGIINKMNFGTFEEDSLSQRPLPEIIGFLKTFSKYKSPEIGCLDAIIQIQQYYLHTSFGNFDGSNWPDGNGSDWPDSVKDCSRIPLFTFNGPTGDPSVDEYTIFFSETSQGRIEYCVMANRYY